MKFTLRPQSLTFRDYEKAILVGMLFAMKADSPQTNLSSITSFDSSLAALEKLKGVLSKNKLEQFIVFNEAYFIVTKNIKDAANKNYFDNPKFVEKFTFSFAKYYFEAVNYTYLEDSKLPEAWSIMNKAKKYKATPNFIFLLMGANAHINRDLQLVLVEIMSQKKTNESLKDIIKIDKLLMKSGKEIINTFQEPNKILDALKRSFVFIYYRPVMYTVLYWRIRAWRNYVGMSKTSQRTTNYDKRSVNNANIFLSLARLLS